MARFILDVANCDDAKIQKVLYDLLEESFLGKELVRITVIDETNEAQFHGDERDALTPQQIERFKAECAK
jgi:hypothetical protein